MKLSPFMKQFKKDLETLTKKQLVKRLLISVEMNANQWNEFDMAYEKLDNEKQICESELIRNEKIYKNMSVFQFIKHKYAK